MDAATTPADARFLGLGFCSTIMDSLVLLTRGPLTSEQQLQVQKLTASDFGVHQIGEGIAPDVMRFATRAAILQCLDPDTAAVQLVILVSDTTQGQHSEGMWRTLCYSLRLRFRRCDGSRIPQDNPEIESQDLSSNPQVVLSNQSAWRLCCADLRKDAT